MDEAMVWHRHVLPVMDPRYATGDSSSSGSGSGTSKDVGSRAALALPAATSAAADSVRSAAAATATAEAAATATATAATATTTAGAAAEGGSAGAETTAAAAAGGAAAAEAPPPAVNRQLLAWGLSEQVACDATNPGFSGGCSAKFGGWGRWGCCWFWGFGGEGEREGQACSSNRRLQCTEPALRSWPVLAKLTRAHLLPARGVLCCCPAQLRAIMPAPHSTPEHCPEPPYHPLWSLLQTPWTPPPQRWTPPPPDV